MTTPAVSIGIAILAWIGLAIGAVVLIVVVALFTRIMVPAREIDAYARDVLAAGNGVAENLEATGELETTRSLGGSVQGLATAYLRTLGLVR